MMRTMSKDNIDIGNISADSQWLANESLKDFAGQWIAVFNEEIIARDESLEKVMKLVDSLKLNSLPLFVRVPEGAIVS